MSNCYSGTSLEYKFEEKNQDKVTQIIEKVKEFYRQLPDDDEWWNDGELPFDYEIEKDTLHLWNEEYAATDQFADILSQLQIALSATEHFIFSTGWWADKPCANAYGGMACMVDPNGEISYCDPVQELYNKT